jgi:plasmid stabilization system protein ParE
VVQKIVWTVDAELTFLEAIDYLEAHFTEKEILKFTNRVEQKLLLLYVNPRLGRKSVKRPSVFKTVLTKKIVLFYQYKPRNREILVLLFWNTMQNPRKLHF